MKKILKIAGIILVLCIIMAGVSTCGSGSSEKKEIVTDTANEDNTDTGATAGDENLAETNTENEENASNTASNTADVTIEEQVLLEYEGLTITATGMENDSIWGEGVKLLIENDSDKNLGVGCNAMIVNDYMISDLFSTTVAPGKKANEVMYMSSTQLEAAGISNIGQIEIYFHIFEGDTYMGIYDADLVTIQTSEYANMDVAAADDGTELYNQDGIRIVGKYVDENSFWGTAVLLYVENETDKNIGVSCDDMSINGFMVSPLFSSTVYAHKKSLDDITLFASDLEDNGIETVEEIELKFHIYDADSYSTITDTEAITFSAK